MTVAPVEGSRRLPGVDGFWVFIGFDAVIFALLFGSFLNDRRSAPELFEASRQTLNLHIGGLDTLILLTSSWLVALAVQAFHRGEPARVPRLLLGGALTGGAFVVSKAIEYIEKLTDGVTPASDTFYSWYFVLTGIHLAHVVAGRRCSCSSGPDPGGLIPRGSCWSASRRSGTWSTCCGSSSSRCCTCRGECMTLLRERVTFVWIALMAATCVTTWVLSKDAFSPEASVVGTFLIAGLKVRYVMLDFMELRRAPTRARIVFEFWIIAVTVMILAFWFLS